MEKRFEGFLAPYGLYILDTYSGEVRFIAHDSNLPTKPNGSATTDAFGLVQNKPTLLNNFSPFENEV